MQTSNYVYGTCSTDGEDTLFQFLSSNRTLCNFSFFILSLFGVVFLLGFSFFILEL